MFSRVHILPKSLDRQFSLWEILSVYIFGENYWDEDKHTHRPKPYAIARRFNKEGYTLNNPYLVEHFTGSRASLIDEMEYSADVVFKTEKARELKEKDDDRIRRTIEATRRLPGTCGDYF